LFWETFIRNGCPLSFRLIFLKIWKAFEPPLFAIGILRPEAVMTSILFRPPLKDHSPRTDTNQQLLNDYISFLQQYSNTLLLKPTAEDFEVTFRPQLNHIDDYDLDESLLILEHRHLEENDCEKESYIFLEEQERSHQLFLKQQVQQAITSNPFIMSTQQQSTSSSQSFSTSTFSSSSDGEAPKIWRKTESTETNPSGTTVRRTSEQPGQAPTEQTLHYDSSGKAIDQGTDAGRIEDVTDADREYLERMEDEYAKREGGA